MPGLDLARVVNDRGLDVTGDERPECRRDHVEAWRKFQPILVEHGVQKRLIEENVWSNPQMKAFAAEDEDPGLNVSLFDLVKAFGEILERAKNRPTYDVEQTDVTVADMIRDLRDQFIEAGPDKPVFILRVFERQRTRRAMIAMFLAVLRRTG